MSSTIFKKNNLSSLVDHHIALLERFGISDEAPFSIIYFSLNNKKELDNIEIFQKILRQTDALFQIKKSYIVMLPGTDWNGSSDLLSGIQEFLDQSPQDNIVTYPDDGIDANTLIRKLKDLVEDNCGDIIDVD